MILIPSDFLDILKISLYLSLIGFSLFFPILLLTKQKFFALKFCIPVSFSFYTLIGYIFYSFKTLQFFGLSSLFLLLVVNLVSMFIIKTKYPNLLSLKLPSSKYSLGYLISFCTLLYTRFHDSLFTTAPGHPDTIYHLNYLQSLVDIHKLPMNFYPPGFHLLFYPLFTYMGDTIYRFSGPILGVLLILSIVFLFVNKLSHRSLILMILLFCLPIFNFLIWQTISFWPTTISYFYFFIILYSLIYHKEVASLTKYLFLSMIALSLAITVSNLFMQLLPTTFLLIIFVFLFRRSFGSDYLWHTIKIFLILCLGGLFVFAHILFQTMVINQDNSFPEIPYSQQIGNQVVTKSNYTSPNPAPSSSSLPNVVLPPQSTTSVLLYNYVTPIVSTIREALNIKGARSPLDISSLKTYFWIFLSFIILAISIRKHDHFLLITSFFSTTFGFISQTGILEMGVYRGRTSIYFLFLPILTSVYLFDKFKKHQFNILVWPMFVIVFIYSISSPPHFFRDYCPEIFNYISSLINRYPNSKFSIISDNYNLQLLSHQITLFPENADSMVKNKATPYALLVYSQQVCNFTPSDYVRASQSDMNFILYHQQQQQSLDQKTKQSKTLFNSPELKDYHVIYQDKNTIFYSPNMVKF